MRLNKSYNMRLSAILLLMVILVPCIAQGQITMLENPRSIAGENTLLLRPSQTRQIIDLNGEWQYRTDDIETWRRVRVPACFPEPAKVEFRKTFRVDAVLLKDYVFQFVALSIPYYSEIRINGKFIGKHSGDGSFSFKLQPGILKRGSNEIQVSVDNSLNSSETTPLRERLWDNIHYGGIVQDVGIVANGPVWAQETNISTSFSGENRPGTVSFRTLLNSGPLNKLEGDTSSTPVSFGRSRVSHYVEIIDPSTNVVVAVSERTTTDIESDRLIPVNISVQVPLIRLWSPEAPNLYTARLLTLHGNTIIDESFIDFGFRTIRASEDGLVLNGQPLLIKGINYMPNSPEHGASMSLSQIERDVLLLKNTGANAVKVLSHNVHPHFYGMCNKYGLLVFQDLPLSRVPSQVLANDGLQTSALNSLKEMVSRDANNPSIIAWGLTRGANGLASGIEIYANNLSSIAESYADQLYYITYAALNGTDIPEYIDFIGYDLPPGSIDESRSQLARVPRTKTGRPVLLTTLMYPIEVGNFNGHSDPRSIDAQAEYILKLYPEIMDSEFPGLFIHAFADWQVMLPIMTYDRVYQYTATTGIMNAYRQKRLAYDVVKARFNNEKPPVVTSGDYKEEHPAIFVIAGILLVFAFAIMYNLFRRFRENAIRAFLRPHNFFSDVRDQRILSFLQTTLVGLLAAYSLSLFGSNLLFYYRISYFADFILSHIFVAPWLKQWVNYTAWNPMENIFVMGALYYLFLVVYALLVRLVSIFFRAKLLLFDCYTIAMWSALPLLVFAPIGMVAYRLMDLPVFEVIFLASFIAMHIWILIRLLKGTSILLDVRQLYFNITGSILFVGLVVLFILTMDGQYNTIDHTMYLQHIWLYVQGL